MAEGFLPPLVLELKAKAGEFHTEVQKARKEIGNLGDDAQRHGTRAETAFAQTAAAGKTAFVGLSATAAIGGAAALKMGGDFQESMRILVTGAGESKANVAQVSAGILDMAGDVGITANTLAQSMYKIQSAGHHGAEGLEVLRAAAQGAKVDGSDLEVVGDALTTVMADLGAGSDQAALLMTKMVEATAHGKMSMEDFASSIHSVLPNAAALHIDFSQVAGAMAEMTAQGVSAQQAAQNLNHMIVKLAAPTAGMTSAMASYGLSATDVAQRLGERGLTGTMELVNKAIMDHMGPAGLTLRSAFEQSREAAESANKMFAALPPEAREVAKSYREGAINSKDFAASVKFMEGPMANLLKQWRASEDRAHGFSAALKSGSPAAQTYNGAMKSILGDQTSLQVALHLTGEATEGFNSAVEAVKGKTLDASGNVAGWADVQKDFNQQLRMAKASFDAIVVQIGLGLIPAVVKAMVVGREWAGWLGEHHGVLYTLAGIIGGAVVVAITAYIASVVIAAGRSVWAFGRMGVSAAQGAARIVQGFRSAQVAGSAFSGWQGTLGGRLRTMTSALGAAGKSTLLFAKTQTIAAASAVKAWAVTAAQAVAQGARIVAAWTMTAVRTIATWVAQGVAAVASAAITAAAWIAANIAMIAATGGIILAIGLLVVAGVWLWKNWRKVWQWIKDATRAAWSWIRGHMRYIVLALGPVAWAAAYLYRHWRQIWAGIKATTAAAWTMLKRVFGFVVKVGLTPIRLQVKVLQTVWGAAWRFVTAAVQRAWSTIRPIIDAVRRGVSSVTSAASKVGGTVSGALGKAQGLLGFADGGFVPGPVGKPQLAVVHGGEYVVSTDEQAGRGTSSRRGRGPGLGAGGDVAVHLYLDGEEIRRVVQRRTLRHQRRNNTNGLAFSY